MPISTKRRNMLGAKPKNIYERVNDLFYREEFILYPPSELLDQVEQQMMDEFADQIISFEWLYEVEFTSIYVQIRSTASTALQIPIGDRLYEIIHDYFGDEYIVAGSVTPVESVNATDGLFNLTCTGGTNFFVDYYPPERARDKPYLTPIHYLRMFDAVRTIHLDSAEQLWERLIRPLDEKYAKHEGVDSFTKEQLAEELRDFLLQHLDFIKHIAQAVNKPRHIIEPVPQDSLFSSNGTGREPQKAFLRAVRKPKREVAMPLPALATA